MILLPETNRLPTISAAKMSSYQINREVQFRVYSDGELNANPPPARGTAYFIEGKKVGRATINQESEPFQ